MPLYSDLAPFVQGSGVDRMVRHPLLTRPFPDDTLAAVVNNMYRDKKQRLRDARRHRDWRTYVWLHEREFRPGALLEIANELDDGAYWRLVAEVWRDAEFIHPNLGQWVTLWESPRLTREELLVPRARLPDDIIVWRCTNHPDGLNGLSWCREMETAIPFAGTVQSRQSRPALMATAVAPRSAIRAWFPERQEVILLPGTYKVVNLIELAPKRAA